MLESILLLEELSAASGLNFEEITLISQDPDVVFYFNCTWGTTYVDCLPLEALQTYILG